MVLEGGKEEGEERRGEDADLRRRVGHRTVLHRSTGQMMMCFAAWGR
jgi:hypothetical protein